MMFFSQYKKIIALCAIPVAITVTFFGYQVIHAQSTRTSDQTMNKQMQALLDAELKPTANAAPVDSVLPKSSRSPTESLGPEVTRDPPTTKSQPTAKPTAKPNYKININQATADDLEKLPGIGASKAKAIIAYRKQSNLFKSLEELMNVKGIGPKIYEKIKGHLEL
jgi:competence protein ComEA